MIFAGPGHLGDVDQALDALLELDEGAVVGEADDLALGRWCRRGTSRDDVAPGILGSLLLETEGDALGLAVELEDHDVDLLAHGEQFARVADPAPGHVGDVKEAVHRRRGR